jgi:hypothetical protein
MLAGSTANGKIRCEIQNPQMFETDPESFSPAIYFIIVLLLKAKVDTIDGLLIKPH